MTRQQRRSKSRWINGLKKRGYTFRLGKVWQRWRWTARVAIWELPIFHADYEAAIGVGIEDGATLRSWYCWPREGVKQ